MGRVVSRTVSAALSDVLGRAFGVSPVAFCCPARSGGRSHHSEPARPAVHRYRDELHVSQRGVVVFLHADPVLFDLSPALLDSAACWTMVVSVYRMRCRMFCAIRLARPVAAKRIVGTRRFRDLSFAGVRARNVACDVVHAVTCARGMVSSSRRGIHNGISPLPRRTATVPRTLPLHLCRFRYGRVLHVGNCRNRWIDLAIPDSRQIVRTGRALLLRPLPHSPTVRHLAGTPHSRGADLDVFVDLHPGARCPQRMGHAPGKRNEYAGEQTRLAEKTSARLTRKLAEKRAERRRRDKFPGTVKAKKG